MHWRLATALVLSGATLNGCSCDAPYPNLHVRPSDTVQVGQVVTFDMNREPGEGDDGIASDTGISWDLDGDGTFGDQPGERVVRRSFDAPGTYRVSLDTVNAVFESWLAEPTFVHGYRTRTITVTAPPDGPQPPAATFEATPNPGYTERDI